MRYQPSHGRSNALMQSSPRLRPIRARQGHNSFLVSCELHIAPPQVRMCLRMRLPSLWSATSAKQRHQTVVDLMKYLSKILILA